MDQRIGGTVENTLGAVPAVCITVRKEVGDRCIEFTAVGTDFDECIAALIRMRDEYARPGPPVAGTAT